MSEPKFTKGPLYAKTTLADEDDYFCVIDSNGKQICSFDKSSNLPLEDIANAHLFAAASYLYYNVVEACEVMCTRCSNLYYDSSMCVETCPVFRWRKTLQKARGEA